MAISTNDNNSYGLSPTELGKEMDNSNAGVLKKSLAVLLTILENLVGEIISKKLLR